MFLTTHELYFFVFFIELAWLVEGRGRLDKRHVHVLIHLLCPTDTIGPAQLVSWVAGLAYSKLFACTPHSDLVSLEI